MKKGYAKLLLPIVAVVVVFASVNAMAASNRKDVYIEFTTDSSLTIALSSDDVSIDNLIPGTADVSNEIDVVVSTNSETGYTLNAVGGTTDNNSTNLIHVDSSIEDTFVSIEPGISVNAITEDRTWGFSIDHGTSFSGMPVFYSGAPALINTTTTPSIDEIPFLIGARANRFQAPGEYRNIVTFVATAKPVPDTIATTRYMQDINDDVYASMEMEKQYQLIDRRDNKKYWVAKLKDGNVWMTQNLNFELTAPTTTLYPDTSNTLEPVTLQVSATRRDAEIGVLGWGYNDSWYDTTTFYPSNVDPNTYVPGGTFAIDSVVSKQDYELVSTEDLDGDNENWHYAVGGRYYHNYGSLVDGSNALCPKGWSLPNNSTSGDVESQYSFQKLLEYYPYLGVAPTYLSPTPYEPAYNYPNYGEWYRIMNSAKYLFTDGARYFYTNNPNNIGSTTIESDDWVYGGGGYNNFASVRCVALRTSVYPFTYYIDTGDGQDTVYYHYEPASWGGADASIRAISMDGSDGIPFGRGDFLGWSTTRGATEPEYVPGDVLITNTSTENKLYAVWETLSTSFDDAFAAAGKTKVDGTHYAMQDMTTSICTAVSTNMASELVDTRDGKIYKVAKLKRTRYGASSTCWMIENLALGSTDTAYQLTPNDTNISADFTLPAVTSPIESSTTAQFGVVNDTDDYGGKAGNNYNFFAATAGTNNASTSSLCPKGWYIPEYSAYYSGRPDEYFSFDELRDAYSHVTNHKTFDYAYGETWSSSRYTITDPNQYNYGTEYIKLANGGAYSVPATGFAKIRCVVRP